MTLLNTADKIYVGGALADRVYLGSSLVWEPPSGEIEYGPSQSIYPVSVSPTNFPETIRYSLGSQILILSDGRITDVRYWRNAGQLTSRFVALWEESGTLLWSATTSGDVDGWNTHPVSPPLLVSGGWGIRVSMAYEGSQNGDGGYPLTDNLTIPVDTADLDWMSGCFASGFPTGFPITLSTVSNNHYFVDIVYEKEEGGATPGEFIPPEFRAKENTTYGARTSITVNKPAGTAKNDILIASLFRGRGNTDMGALTEPPGFTLLGTTNVMQSGGAFYGQFKVYWKRAAASEPSSYTWDHPTHTTSDQAYIAAYSGCPTSGDPIDVFSQNAGTHPVVGSIATALSVTTTQGNDKLIWLGHNWDAGGALTPPGGMTERYDHLTYSADQTVLAVGATGNRTQAQASTNPWAVFLIALKGIDADNRPWTPDEITADMFGWWDASNAASLTFADASLLEIADQGPNNVRMGRADAIGPTLGSINGLGALAFINDRGLMTSSPTTFNDFTIFAVFKPGNSDGFTYERIVDHAYADGWWFGRTGSSQTWGGGVMDGPGTGYGVFVPLANNEVHLISNVREGSDHRISGNGGAVVNSHTVTTAATPSRPVYMAQDNLGTSDMYDGSIAEVLIWKRTLPADEMAKVEGYLAHKWGIQAKLPTGHLYKIYAPGISPPPAGPPVITGLVHWLDASQLELADGAAVSVWPNLGGGAQPTFVNSTFPVFKAGVLNGKPVVRFVTGQCGLRSAYSGAEPQNYTLLYVVRWVGNGVGRAFTAQYPPSNFLVGMHTSMRDAMYDNGTWLYGTTNTWAGWTAPGPWRMYEADGVLSLDSRFFIDGVRISTVGPGNGGGLTNGWGLSGYENSTSETIDIEVAELLLYDHRLSDAERIQVEEYLRAKWGLVAPADFAQQLPAPDPMPPPLEMP